ncbi:MAG: hypothetical protein H7327_07670 [Herminiimonas sp.]|nr:hypothetical protein [Herminiimonas sp.]
MKSNLAVADAGLVPSPIPCQPAPPEHPLPVGSPRPAAADVANLFARFDATAGACGYREIHADADAADVAARWPLLAEWLSTPPPLAGRPA